MVLKLNMEKFNSKVKQELKEKMAKERSSMYLGVVISLIAMLVGCIVSYAAYLYFGINSPTNLFCFILGIAVFCLGFNKLFEGIGDYQSKMDYAKYKVDVYGAYGVASFGSKTPEREITFENGTFTEKSSFGENGVINLVEAKDILRVYVLADHSAMLLVTPDLIRPCILLSDAFDGFNCSEIINEIKKYNEGVFVKQLVPTFNVRQLEHFAVQSISAIVNTNIEDWVSVVFNDSIEDYVDDAPVIENKEEVKSESSEEKVKEKSVENVKTVQTETRAGNYTYAEKSEDEKPEEEKEEKAEVKKDDSTESTSAEEIEGDSEGKVENKEVDSVNN